MTMGVYRHAKSPYWWIRVPRPGQPALRESTKILIDGATKWERDRQRQLAEEAYAARLSALARQRYALPAERAGIRVDAFAEWYDTHKIATHRGAERDREMLVRLVAFFGAYQLAAIDRPLVEEYLTKRTTTDGRTASCANREVDLLKAMLAAAVPRHLEASPIAGMPRLRQVRIRKRVLEPDEESRLLAQLRPQDQALYLAGVDTLVRLGDLIDLRRADDHGSYLDIHDSKTGPYQVPISTRLRQALDALPASGPLTDDHLYYFWWRRRAKSDRDRRGAVRQLLKRACARAGIPYGRAVGGITWHTGTRATGATRMLRLGVDPATVQAVGHWASLQQMGDYLQTTGPRMLEAVNLIGSCTPGVPPESETPPKRAKPRRTPRAHRRPIRRPPPGKSD